MRNQSSGMGILYFIAAMAVMAAVMITAAIGEAGTKTALFVDQTGTITAGATYGANTNSFEVTDPTLFKCVRVEGLAAEDNLNLVREDYAGTGWDNVTDGRGVVQLNSNRRSACPAEIGTYALAGDVSGTVTAYTEE